MHSHNLEYCPKDDPTANVTFVHSDGRVYSAGKYATDNYACDLRVKGTREVLHDANWSEKHGDPPRIPETAMFVARACEERLRQQNKKAA